MKMMAVSIKSVSPLIHNCPRLLDPACPFNAAMKPLIAARSKRTETQINELAELQWRAGLYFDSYIGPTDHDRDGLGPVLPGANFEAMLVDACKKSRRGKLAKAGLFVMEDQVRIDYDGPRDPTEMYSTGRFCRVDNMTVGMARVAKLRPTFIKWAATFTVNFDPDMFSAPDVVSLVELAGKLIGIGDSRPRFGRFNIANVEV